ncbi:MAG: tetratricopeptide repeat protein [Candidatus Kapaibacterium sp.]
MNKKKLHKASFISMFTLLFLVGCQTFDNFTTYFNTYYNMERLMDKAEDEFDFMAFDVREIQIYVPDPNLKEREDYSLGPPPFMKDLIITQRQRQAVETKLDSIIIKGSKILAYKSKTDYVEGAIFMMAKSFFYQEEWRPSEIKCSELVDKYPNSDFSPDAHLLFAKNSLIQRNFYTGKIMLSRTVDIAWQKKRYDILSEAFRLQAELSLYEGDKEEALRPYRQAVAQSENAELAAKWQLELGALLYRIGEFEKAAKEFAKVRDFSPTYEGLYESYLYEAQSSARIKNFERSNELLTHLEEDSKFEEWMGYTYSGRLTEKRMKADDDEKLEFMENHSDTTYVNNLLINTYSFERGMDFYYSKNYFKAQQYFSKARNQRTPVFKQSSFMFKALSELRYKVKSADDYLKRIENDTTGVNNDTIRYSTALLYFEAGRIHEELGNIDSVKFYYEKSYKVSPKNMSETSRFLYSYARVIREDDAYKSDSLYEVVADNYAMTDYGRDAMKILGFTEEFIVDTVQELFASGMKLKKISEYPFAVKQFYSAYQRFPGHKLAPRSLYNIGWIFERDLVNLDSAIYYYGLLIEKYPRSEYALEMTLPLAQLKSIRSGEKLPDSLSYKSKYVVNENNAIKGLPNAISTTPNQNNPNLNKPITPDDLINDPSKALEEGEGTLSKPLEMLKNIDFDKLNPLNLFNSEEPETELPPDQKTIEYETIPADSTKKK